MAVGKGSILRASNANAATKEKKTVKENVPASVEHTSIEAQETEVTTKVADLVAKVPVEALKNVPKTWSVPVLNEAKVQSLAVSIKKYGMLVPVLVYKNKKQDLLVLKGGHRVAAAKEAGLSEIPVSFVEAATDAVAKAAYTELRSFEKSSETEKEYEVVSSITVNMPSYLL